MNEPTQVPLDHEELCLLVYALDWWETEAGDKEPGIDLLRDKLLLILHERGEALD